FGCRPLRIASGALRIDRSGIDASGAELFEPLRGFFDQAAHDRRTISSAKANIAPKQAMKALTPPANSQELLRRAWTSESLGSIDTMPRIGRLLVSRRPRASWNVGINWLTAKLIPRPAASDSSSAIPRSPRRFGATGCGDTRGGSITRNCAPVESWTSLPIVADSRRA